MTGTVRIVRSLEGSCRSVQCNVASCSATIRLPIGLSDFSKRYGASCSATIRLLIGSSNFFKRNGASCSATIRLPIGSSNFFKRVCVFVPQQSGLQTFRCAYNTSKDCPFLIITYVTRWSNFTVHYALCRACKMMM